MTLPPSILPSPKRLLVRRGKKVPVKPWLLRFMGGFLLLFGFQTMLWGYCDAASVILSFLWAWEKTPDLAANAKTAMDVLRLAYTAGVALAMIAVGALTLFTGLSAARGLTPAFVFMKRLLIINALMVAIDLPLSLMIAPHLIYDSQSGLLSVLYPYAPTLSPTLHAPSMCGLLNEDHFLAHLSMHPWLAMFFGAAAFGLCVGGAFQILVWIEKQISAYCSVCGAPFEVALSDLSHKKACPKCGADYKLKPSSVWDMKSKGIKLAVLIVCTLTWALAVNNPEELAPFYEQGFIVLTFSAILVAAIWAGEFGRIPSLVMPLGIVPAWAVCRCHLDILGLLAVVVSLALAWLCYLMVHSFLLSKTLGRRSRRYLLALSVLAPLILIFGTGATRLGETGAVFLIITIFLCLPLYTLGVDLAAARLGLIEVHRESPSHRDPIRTDPFPSRPG